FCLWIGERRLAACATPIAIFHLPSTIVPVRLGLLRGHSPVGRAPALQAGSQGLESPCLQASLASRKRAKAVAPKLQRRWTDRTLPPSTRRTPTRQGARCLNRFYTLHARHLLPLA